MWVLQVPGSSPVYVERSLGTRLSVGTVVMWRGVGEIESVMLFPLHTMIKTYRQYNFQIM